MDTPNTDTPNTDTPNTSPHLLIYLPKMPRKEEGKRDKFWAQ